MAYQIKSITKLTGKRKGLDVAVNLGFQQKTLYFSSQKVFDAEFPARMMNAELHVQHDLDQAAYDKLHPTFYSREDMHKMLLDRNMIRETQTVEDLPTKSAIWAGMTDMSTSEALSIWNKIFKTTLGQPKIDSIK